MKKNVAYIRVANKDDYACDVQLNAIINYVDRLNIKLDDTYIDNGYSGTNFDRPAFKRLVNDIQAGEIDRLYIKSQSRLSRDVMGLLDCTEDFFPNNGVKFYFIDGYEYSNVGKLIDTIQKEKLKKNDMVR